MLSAYLCNLFRIFRYQSLSPTRIFLTSTAAIPQSTFQVAPILGQRKCGLLGPSKAMCLLWHLAHN